MASLGEYRVGIGFNPSGDPKVNVVKDRTAALIYLAEAEKVSGETPGEVLRLLALAQTAYEEAAMWFVKALTKPPR